MSSVVGADHARVGLLALAANPTLGGLLVRGDKGTGKSTLARSLARLLPAVRVNEGCPFGCPSDLPDLWCDGCREAPPRPTTGPAPFVTLPLGATEDQVVGSIDLEHALREGERRFEGGLLARANGGVLYVDEVNLLDDHLVDLLLDVAASKVNVVAREGVTLDHPADLLLVGTMNPEEGELRPQLLDRFGLCADVGGVEVPEERAEIVSRVLAFEADPATFAERWADEERALGERIQRARDLLPRMKVDGDLCLAAARLSVELEVDGHRADILLVKTAMTVAALDGRPSVGAADFEEAATLVYPHRVKRRPFAEERPDPEALRERARALFGRDGEARPKEESPG